jgi:hypothetical protein
VVSQKKWTSLSANEKLDTLHAEIKTTNANTRSLKKIVTAVVARVNDMRRYMGMKPSM